MIDPFWWPIIVGGTLAGASSGMLGTYIVGMRIPFLAVCVAHAALAGAVYGALAGLSGAWLLAPALAAAAVVALALGLLEEHVLHVDANVLIGVLFSLSLGLAFLGIGMFPALGKPDDEVRQLLWGSLLLCGWRDVGRMGGAAGALALFVLLLRKEMRAILFSRAQATAAGVRVTIVWTGFLVLTSLVLTVNFQTVGGLMIYSLITNPAVAAIQLARGHDRVLGLATLLGALSGLGGFAVAFRLNLPVGATIVICSSLLVVAALARAHLRRRYPTRQPS